MISLDFIADNMQTRGFVWHPRDDQRRKGEREDWRNVCGTIMEENR